MLERFSEESCPMNKKNLEMIKDTNDLSDEIKAKAAACADLDELRSMAEEYRPKLLQALQKIIDYNSVDYIVLDSESHIVIDEELPEFYFAISNPRHMAWGDAEITKEATKKGLKCRPMKGVI